MRAKDCGSFFIVRIDRGEEVIASLLELCMKKGIRAGSISGIGSLSRAELGHYTVATKEYTTKTTEEPLELTGMSGNIGEMDGKPYIHAHASLSDRRMNAIGGHFKEGVVEATCEIIITPAPSAVVRKRSEEIGLNLLEL